MKPGLPIFFILQHKNLEFLIRGFYVQLLNSWLVPVLLHINALI
jgi:hypothetical protein